ncbi:MAG: toprim domain-containing protein [Oscillospiraceae bacterium]
MNRLPQRRLRGYDEHSIARHAQKRNGSESTYKGNAESCDPRYSFHWTGTDNTIYLFEAPIDMLSFISLHKENWRSHSYAAACCVGDQVLFQMLKANSNINTVYLCMDNDAAGQAANKRISDKLFR